MAGKSYSVISANKTVVIVDQATDLMEGKMDWSISILSEQIHPTTILTELKKAILHDLEI